MDAFEVDLDEFKRMTKDLLDAIPTLNYDELQNGFKCLSLAYLNGNFTESDTVIAVSYLNYVGARVTRREAELSLRTEEVEEEEELFYNQHGEHVEYPDEWDGPLFNRYGESV